MSAKESFQQLAQPYSEKGLKAALLTDREGVVILECSYKVISSMTVGPIAMMQ
jgi:hypothetical protein